MAEATLHDVYMSLADKWVTHRHRLIRNIHGVVVAHDVELQNVTTLKKCRFRHAEHRIALAHAIREIARK